MRVAELAKALDVTADTVRFYTKIGLLNPVKNKQNGYWLYSQRDYRRLHFIVCARRLGFSVNDLSQLLKEADAGKSPCPVARRLIEQRLEELQHHFDDTLVLLERMRIAVKEWRKHPNAKPTGKMICHLIENFSNT